MRLSKSLSALTLASTLAVAVCSVAMKMDTYRSSPDSLQLLKHVVAYQKDWRLILNERVIIQQEQVPYSQRFPGLIDVSQMDTRAIINKVLYDLSHIGSYVEFAVIVLHKSLACYSLKQLAFQSHYLSRMFDKFAEPGEILVELGRIKQTVTVILSKMCIYSTDLSIIFSLYWELISLIQFDSVQHVRQKKYPPTSKSYVDAIHIKILEFLELNCCKSKLDGNFLLEMNIKVNFMLMDEVLNLIVDLKELKRLSQEHEIFVETYYMNLRYDVLSRYQWNQIFYYVKSVPKTVTAHDTNSPITYQPIIKDKPAESTNQPQYSSSSTSGSII